jgi:putative nucleotidyltransferase with HDIG domain
MTLSQRLRQFAEASREPSSEDAALAAEILSAPLFALWEAQHPRDRVHSAATARWLIERGHEERDLLAAALLHDIGKGPQRRRDRVGWVALGWIRAAGRVANVESRFEFRRALHRTREHSREGAKLLRAAGAGERIAELTLRHHESGPNDPVLALLQRADAAS